MTTMRTLTKLYAKIQTKKKGCSRIQRENKRKKECQASPCRASPEIYVCYQGKDDSETAKSHNRSHNEGPPSKSHYNGVFITSIGARPPPRRQGQNPWPTLCTHSLPGGQGTCGSVKNDIFLENETLQQCKILFFSLFGDQTYWPFCFFYIFLSV